VGLVEVWTWFLDGMDFVHNTWRVILGRTVERDRSALWVLMRLVHGWKDSW